MMMRDIVFQSTYDNIREFIKGKDIKQLMELSTYIVSTEALTRPPNELERQFIKDFFTETGWAEHIQYQKGTQKEKYFLKPPSFDLETISKLLFLEVMKLAKKQMIKLTSELSASNLVSQIKQKEIELLVRELQIAVLESYDENGVFWKDDGWCNVSLVLQKYKLIKLEK